MSTPSCSPYIPPSVGGGCPYCFNPDSATIRRALIEPPPTPDTSVDASLLAEDIAWYHRLLQCHYAGYGDLLRAQGLDVAGFFADWAAGLRAHRGAIRVRDALCEPLIRLQQVLPDGHRVFPGAGGVGDDPRVAVHEYQAPVGTPEAGGDPTQIPGAHSATWRTVPLLRPDGSWGRVTTVSATGPGETRQVGGLRLRRRAPAPRPPQAPVYEWHTCAGAAVITLRRFGGQPPALRELDRFPADYPLHARFPAILFDLRGNAGGSLGYSERWLAQALGGDLRRQPLLDFAPSACGDWNRLVEAQVRGGSVDASEPRGQREQALAAMRAGAVRRGAVAGLALRIPGTRGPAGLPYGGRVFALIDRGTGSSGELTAWELRRNLNAVLIGERSGGGLQYGQLSMFVLPATGLVCGIPTRRFFYDEEVEGIGLPVEVYLGDAAMGADEVARCLMRKRP